MPTKPIEILMWNAHGKQSINVQLFVTTSTSVCPEFTIQLHKLSICPVHKFLYFFEISNIVTVLTQIDFY